MPQCQGHFFRLDLEAPDGSALRLSELEQRLREIKRAAAAAEVAVPVGWLTSLDREAWATARAKIVAESEQNVLAFETMYVPVRVESAFSGASKRVDRRVESLFD